MSAPTGSEMAVENEIEEAGSAGQAQGRPAPTVRTAQLISVPRWLVYFQAGLLGVVATTFFVFGLMVGSLTSGSERPNDAKVDCRVSGRVTYRERGETKPDEGAVVFLLPKNRKPDERMDASSVSPAAFQALDNPGIEKLHQLGGAVVRADENGMFEVIIDGNESDGIDYHVLVVSRNQAGTETEQLSKPQVAAIGTFFMPVERLVHDRAIYWSSLTARSKSQKLSAVEF